MFFGLGSGKEEKTGIGELPFLVQVLFDRKISDLYSKSSRMLIQIEESKKLFLTACDKFDEISSEPDLEGLPYYASASHITSQKPLYVATLKHAVASGGIESPTQKRDYSFYEMRLIAAEGMINEILKTNGKFRNVVYAYSRNLEKFKQSYTYLEEYVKLLRSEIELRQGDISEYKAILYAAQELQSLISEREALSKEALGLSALDSGKARTVSEEEEKEAMHKLAAKNQEIDTLNSSIAQAHSSIVNLLYLIDKAARKYDYGSLSKVKVTAYIEDPEKMLIASDEGYSDFYSQMQSLAKDVHSDRIALKNKTEVTAAINLIISGKIAEHIAHIGALRLQLESRKHELRDLEMIDKELKAIGTSKASREISLSQVKERIKEIDASLSAKKSKLQTDIAAAYKKKIAIML